MTEFIIGYMLPGRPIAMMLFKTYGYITMAQALFFLQDMKLAHYMKVPVRISLSLSLFLSLPLSSSLFLSLPLSSSLFPRLKFFSPPNI